MPRSPRRSRAVLPAVIVLVAALAACDDPYTGPASHLSPPAVAYNPEVTMFVGDTVNIADLILMSEGDAASCMSTDEMVATVLGVVDIVGESAGEVSLRCTRAVRIDDPYVDQEERQFFDYDVRVRVPARVTGDEPAAWWDGAKLRRSR